MFMGFDLPKCGENVPASVHWERIPVYLKVVCAQMDEKEAESMRVLRRYVSVLRLWEYLRE